MAKHSKEHRHRRAPPSPAQRANMERFAAMARARAHGRAHAAHHSPRSTMPHEPHLERGPSKKSARRGRQPVKLLRLLVPLKLLGEVIMGRPGQTAGVWPALKEGNAKGAGKNLVSGLLLETTGIYVGSDGGTRFDPRLPLENVGLAFATKFAEGIAARTGVNQGLTSLQKALIRRPLVLI